MKELELTSNAALTDVVYEAALNGSLLNVKLVTGAVGSKFLIACTTRKQRKEK